MTTFYHYQEDNGVSYAVPLYHEGPLPFTYEEAPRETSSSPLSSSSWDTTSSSTLASDPPSPNPAPSSIPDWEPEAEALSQAAKEAIKTYGIGRYLYLLAEHNLASSAQQWSQFPDKTPEECNDPGRYMPTDVYLHHLLDDSSLLECERCGAQCDLDFNVVDPDQGAADGRAVAYVMPYVHCPLKSIQTCFLNSRPEWRALQTRLLHTDKLSVHRDLQQHLLTKRATKIRADLFEEDRLEPVTREILDAYRGVRVLTHRLSLLRKEESAYFSDSEDELIDELPVWGDLMTDVSLTEKGLLYEQHLRLMYGISAQAADYLYRWHSEWELEVKWLNGYAGRSRLMSLDGRQDLRKVAEKTGSMLNRLVSAEKKLDGTPGNLRAFEDARAEARGVFRELHSSLLRISGC
ncbi:hypothetical protein E4U41_002201 [Claviceps citrina]|nr:hypothetical protein E4U41_002201 [Claviceps citrina]